MKLWCEHHDMSRDQFEFLDRCFQRLDEAYRKWIIDHPPDAQPG